MEINITALASEDAFDYSHSRAEGGEDAGQNTWRAALAGPRILSTPEEIQECRDHIQAMGFGEDTQSMPEDEIHALFLQLVSGDIRECPAILDGIMFTERDGAWWHEHESTPDMETGPFDSRSEAYRDACRTLPHLRGGYPSAGSLTEVDWLEAEAMAHEGVISGSLFAGEPDPDGNREYYYHLGC